jgi:hypothetical protein
MTGRHCVCLQCLLYRKLQEAHRRSHMAAELLVQGSTLSVSQSNFYSFCQLLPLRSSRLFGVQLSIEGTRRPLVCLSFVFVC